MAYEGDTPIQALIEEDQQKNTNSKPQSTEMSQVLEDSSEEKHVATPNEFVVQLDPKKLSASQQLNLEKIEDAYKNTTSLSILLIGKTGTGKSTIINGILEANIAGCGTQRAEVGSGLDSCTKEFTKYVTRQNDVEVTVWDSPGLQDGTGKEEEYLKQMKQECCKRDLTIYCIKLSDGKFVRGDDNPEVRTMKKFTQIFGSDFWKTTVIVLTFANMLEANHQEDWEELSKEDKIKAFNTKIQEWINRIKDILLKDVTVPENIVKAIPIVPAGHKKSDLLGCDSWLTKLWLCCITRGPAHPTSFDYTKYIKIGIVVGSTLVIGVASAAASAPTRGSWLYNYLPWAIMAPLRYSFRYII